MIGREIGSYRILQRLGEGGVGEVFAGIDLMLNRAVAIKALRPEFSRDATAAARFRAEAESLARLGHRNITTVYTLMRDGDALFLVMELVAGRTLEALLLGCGRLTETESLAVVTQVLDGLGYAHAAGVIHRDIKPTNLMVAPSGLVKIMDFGIARVRGSGRMTREGAIVGTLAYMSPEQIQGGEGDERSDIYSLAIVLYELLSGSPPFVCRSEYELIRAQVEAPPPRLQQRVDGIRPDVDAALMTALAKQPAERFPTTAAFAKALGVAGDEAAAVTRVADRLGGIVLAATQIGTAPQASGGVGAPPQQRQVAPTRLACAVEINTFFPPEPGYSADPLSAGRAAPVPPATALSPMRGELPPKAAPWAVRRRHLLASVALAVTVALSVGLGVALLGWGRQAGEETAVTAGRTPAGEPVPTPTSEEAVSALPGDTSPPPSDADKPPDDSIAVPSPLAMPPQVDDPGQPTAIVQPNDEQILDPSRSNATTLDPSPSTAQKHAVRKRTKSAASQPDQEWKIIRE